MIEYWKECLRPTHANPLVVLSLLASLGIALLPLVLRSGAPIARDGSAAGTRSAFRREGETRRMIVVVVLATAAALACAWRA